MLFKSTNILLISIVAFQLISTSQGFLKNIFQLSSIKTSASTPKEATSAAEATGSASKALVNNNEYWFPWPDHLRSLDKELNLEKAVILRDPSSNQFRVSKTSQEEMNRRIAYSKKASIDKYSLEHNYLRARIQEAMSKGTRVVDQREATLIQLGFKQIWENSADIQEAEVKQWLEFLSDTVRKNQIQDHVGAQLSVSALYGLNSLQLKYAQNQNLLNHILDTKTVVQEKLNTIRSRLNLENMDNVPWMKEMISPSRGFSKQLGAENTLRELAKDDKDMTNALSTSVGESEPALASLKENFSLFTAHKRILVLAVCRHDLKILRHKQPTRRFLEETRNTSPFENEKQLINSVLEELTSGSRRSRTGPAT